MALSPGVLGYVNHMCLLPLLIKTLPEFPPGEVKVFLFGLGLPHKHVLLLPSIFLTELGSAWVSKFVIVVIISSYKYRLQKSCMHPNSFAVPSLSDETIKKQINSKLLLKRHAYLMTWIV